MLKKVIPLILVFLIALSLPVMAEEIQVRAYVNRNKIELGQSVTLTIKVIGTSKAEAPEIEVPDSKVRYYGPSTQISIVQNKRTESISHRYSLVPNKTGMIKIPSFEVEIGGQVFSTQSLEIKVIEGKSGQERTLDQLLQEHIFLEMELSEKSLYLNQKVPITINFFFDDQINLENVSYPKLESENFVIGSFGRPKKERVIKDGKYYTRLPFKTSLQPVTTGEHKLAPVKLKAEVILPRNDGFGSFFNYEVYPLNLSTDEIPITVKDFPEQGRPDSFKGAIGRFKMKLSVDKEQVKIGEPITIRTQISGEGNFKTVNAPLIENSEGLKVYDPQLLEDTHQNSNGEKEKIFEQVIIIKEQLDTLPGVIFCYFDPEREEYKTLQKKSIPIQVIGGDKASDQILNYGQQNNQPVGEDILYIKETVSDFKPVGQSVLRSPGFIGYNLTILIALLAGFLVKVKKDRVSKEERRRKEVRKESEELLKRAEDNLSDGSSDDFYDYIYRAVQIYMKEYFQLTITGISRYENQKLLKAGLDRELIETIEEFYQKVDEKRFAGRSGDQADMKEILELARHVIDKIETEEVA